MNKKNIIVTGASGDIGGAICNELADENTRLFMIYNSNRKRAQKLLESITGRGYEAYIFACNLSISEEVDTMIDKISEKYGEIYALVNNAGRTMDSRIENITDEMWDSIIKDNLYSCFYCTRKVFDIMKKSNHGKIVNISSTSAIEGNFGQCNYVASKCGIIGISKVTALEGATFNIRVNTICPGIHNSSMINRLSEDIKNKLISKVPLKYIAECKEIAYAVAFLISDKSDYITGQTICVNGGLTMV